MPSFTATEIAERLGGRVVGSGAVRIEGLAPIDRAGAGELAHLSSAAWRDRLAHCGAAAVLVRAADAGRVPGTAIVVDDPYLAYARVSRL